MGMNMTWSLGAGVLVAAAGLAHADTVTANFDIPVDPGFNVGFFIANPVNPALPNPRFVEAGAIVINGRRTDLPAGPGVNNDIGLNFPTFCVELMIPINVSVGNTFSGPALTYDVFNVQGSTTNTGGLTGPVTFSALQTQRLGRLWADFGFNPLIQTNLDYSAAFQLAVWKISYEADLATLDLTDISQRMYLTGPLPAAFTQAQAFLTAADTAGPVQPLYLLTNAVEQDLLTPVPAPGAASLLAVAGLVAARRRR